MKKLSVVLAVMMFLGVFALGCEKKQTEQNQTQTEQAPAKKAPVGC